MTDKRDAAIDRLYELPLSEFTGARDELAGWLRGEGDREAAAEVKRLRKPSVAAWALNQVRRNDRGRSDELIEAGRRLREAQEQLLAGGGREQLKRAVAEERRLVGELARHAERELVAAAGSFSGSVQEKLRATLHAVSTDPDAREGFAAGRLVRDHEASGLGPLSGKAGSARARDGKRRKETPAGADAAAERQARRLEQRIERARARRRELDDEGEVARRQLSEARQEAARAASRLERAESAEERARRRAEQAADAVEQLERDLRDLRNG